MYRIFLFLVCSYLRYQRVELIVKINLYSKNIYDELTSFNGVS